MYLSPVVKPSLRPPARPLNMLLAALPPAEYERLIPMLERVEVQRGEVIYDFDKPIEFAHFPETLISSMVHPLRDGSAVESTTVGSEGVAGIALFLGNNRMAAQEFCQVGGESLRMSAADFKRESRNGHLHNLLLCYTQALLTQTAMTAVCNGAHNIEQRCARWLLHSRDRLRSDELPLTQEFIGEMLGVRRASVNETLHRLAGAGCIEVGYGRVRVTNRECLEGFACECYDIIRREFARLLGGRELPNPLQGVRTQVGGMSALRPVPQDRQPG